MHRVHLSHLDDTGCKHLTSDDVHLKKSSFVNIIIYPSIFFLCDIRMLQKLQTYILLSEHTGLYRLVHFFIFIIFFFELISP